MDSGMQLRPETSNYAFAMSFVEPATTGTEMFNLFTKEVEPNTTIKKLFSFVSYVKLEPGQKKRFIVLFSVSIPLSPAT
jgi:hypothetical protein